MAISILFSYADFNLVVYSCLIILLCDNDVRPVSKHSICTVKYYCYCSDFNKSLLCYCSKQ